MNVFAPSPRASVRIATIANKGFRTSVRAEYLKSCVSCSSQRHPRSSRGRPPESHRHCRISAAQRSALPPTKARPRRFPQRVGQDETASPQPFRGRVFFAKERDEFVVEFFHKIIRTVTP